VYIAALIKTVAKIQ